MWLQEKGHDILNRRTLVAVGCKHELFYFFFFLALLRDRIKWRDCLTLYCFLMSTFVQLIMSYQPRVLDFPRYLAASRPSNVDSSIIMESSDRLKSARSIKAAFTDECLHPPLVVAQRLASCLIIYHFDKTKSKARKCKPQRFGRPDLRGTSSKTNHEKYGDGFFLFFFLQGRKKRGIMQKTAVRGWSRVKITNILNNFCLNLFLLAGSIVKKKKKKV